MLRESKFLSTLVVIVAYLVSCLLGYIYFISVDSSIDLYKTLLISDVIATVVIFGFSLGFKNSSIYDAYWSVIPMVILAGLSYYFSIDIMSFTTSAALFWITMIWGARLTHNWYRGWPNLKHEDWRYGKLRKDNPKIAMFIDFSGIHLFPTLIVFLALMPSFWNFEQSLYEWNWLNYLGIFTFVISIFFETVGDNQLRKFVLSKPEKSAILKTGLWKYTRHPNYFGEATFWWSIYLLSYSSELPTWYLICPLSITCLFVFISIPMMDKRMKEKRPHYADHMKTTSGFFPWFPKSN